MPSPSQPAGSPPSGHLGQGVSSGPSGHLSTIPQHSAQTRDGVEHGVCKTSNDKASKKGRLKLVRIDGKFLTVPADAPAFEANPDMLQVVYENGELLGHNSWGGVRNRAHDYPVEEPLLRAA